MQENFRGFTFVDDSIMTQHMRKLDLDKMDEDIEDHHSHRDSYDAVSEKSILSADEDDDDMLVPGSSARGQRMSGVEETMFEMR